MTDKNITRYKALVLYIATIQTSFTAEQIATNELIHVGIIKSTIKSLKDFFEEISDNRPTFSRQRYRLKENKRKEASTLILEQADKRHQQKNRNRDPRAPLKSINTLLTASEDSIKQAQSGDDSFHSSQEWARRARVQLLASQRLTKFYQRA